MTASSHGKDENNVVLVPGTQRERVKGMGITRGCCWLLGTRQLTNGSIFHSTIAVNCYNRLEGCHYYLVLEQQAELNPQSLSNILLSE